MAKAPRNPLAPPSSTDLHECPRVVLLPTNGTAASSAASRWLGRRFGTVASCPGLLGTIEAWTTGARWVDFPGSRPLPSRSASAPWWRSRSVLRPTPAPRSAPRSSTSPLARSRSGPSSPSAPTTSRSLRSWCWSSSSRLPRSRADGSARVCRWAVWSSPWPPSRAAPRSRRARGPRSSTSFPRWWARCAVSPRSATSLPDGGSWHQLPSRPHPPPLRHHRTHPPTPVAAPRSPHSDSSASGSSAARWERCCPERSTPWTRIGRPSPHRRRSAPFPRPHRAFSQPE
jgi:hypothetical protein